jgi:hypothetical protein
MPSSPEVVVIGSGIGGAARNITNRVTIMSVPFYDVSPDGKILLEQLSQKVSPSVTVVTNFTEGLKK